MPTQIKIIAQVKIETQQICLLYKSWSIRFYSLFY